MEPRAKAAVFALGANVELQIVIARPGQGELGERFVAGDVLHESAKRVQGIGNGMRADGCVVNHHRDSVNQRRCRDLGCDGAYAWAFNQGRGLANAPCC